MTLPYKFEGKNMKLNKTNILTPDMIRGMFDADGAILFEVRKRPGAQGKPFLSFGVYYEFEQSFHQQEHVTMLAEQLQAKTLIRNRLSGRNAGKHYFKLKVLASSVNGKVVTELYANNYPLTSNRFIQFKVLQQILELQNLGKMKPRADVITILRLIQFVSSPAKAKRVSDFLKNHESYGISHDDSMVGLEKAKTLIAQIRADLVTMQNSLKTLKLSQEYILGLHLGDGSISCIYQKDGNKVNVIPTWSITLHADDVLVLEALKSHFGEGRINKCGSNALQFLIQHRGLFEKLLLPIFGSIQMPPYKQQQWDRTLQAIELMDSKKHLTSQGWAELIELTYDISYNSKRRYSKSYYMAFGDMRK